MGRPRKRRGLRTAPATFAAAQAAKVRPRKMSKLQARHFSAGLAAGEPESPVRDDRRRGRAFSVVPDGTWFATEMDPARKCWAIFFRPLGWHREPDPGQENEMRPAVPPAADGAGTARPRKRRGDKLSPPRAGRGAGGRLRGSRASSRRPSHRCGVLRTAPSGDATANRTPQRRERTQRRNSTVSPHARSSVPRLPIFLPHIFLPVFPFSLRERFSLRISALTRYLP